MLYHGAAGLLLLGSWGWVGPEEQAGPTTVSKGACHLLRTGDPPALPCLPGIIQDRAAPARSQSVFAVTDAETGIPCHLQGI